MSRRPKLIILNGPLGSGKSTLAARYANEHPMTLRLDVDEVWYMISHWRDHNDSSTRLAKTMAIAMAHEALSDGSDVVVPQIIQTDELAERFRAVAETCQADYYEILLSVPKDEAIERFKRRNVLNGHETGFREGGIIATQGREQKLADMYDNMMAIAIRRESTIIIESECDDEDGTYAAMIDRLEP